MEIGETIPDLEFEIYHNDEIKKTKLSDYRGKWLVLMFYPADFTFVCPTEFKDMSDNYEGLQQEGAEVVSISTDTVYVHKAWHDSSPIMKSVRFPMGADPTGTICRVFNTYIKNEGVSLRGTFLISPDGVVKAMEVHDNSIGRCAKEIIRKLKAAKFVSENPGNVCPANWQPGEKTLKPGLDLVGKL